MEMVNLLAFQRNRINKMSMKSRIVSALVLVSFLTLVIAGVTSYYGSRLYIEKEAINSSRQINYLISTNLDSIINNIDNILIMHAINDEIVDYFKNARYDDEYEKIERIRKLENMLRNTLFSNNIIESLILYPTRGYSLSVGQLNTSMLKDFNNFSIMRNTLNSGKKTLWFGVHDFEGNNQGYSVRNIISAACKVRIIDETENLGVIELHINEASLYKLFKSLNKINNSGVIIFDTYGNIVTGDSNSRHMPENYFDGIKSHISGKENDTFENYLLDSKYLFNMVTLGNGWKIVHFQPYANMVESSLAVGRIIFVVGVIVIIFCSCLALLLSSKLTKPLRHLVSIVNEGGESNNINIAKTETGNEIDSLYNSYNDLTRKIKQSELDTLRAQIAPHFLYNTLNSIKCRAFLDNNEFIAKMTGALIDLLELSINNPNELISIKDEFKIIDSYVLLQQSRQEVNFNVVFEAPQELLEYLIPKMLLQPIVENSILHGFSETEKEYEIHISVYSEDSLLFIRIRDNGIGLSNERIDEVLRPKNERGKTKFSRIGLNNVNDRIKLYLGDRYGLEISSIEGKGATVLITVPCIINH